MRGEESECVRKEGFIFSSRRRHTRLRRDWSSDVCSSDLCDLYPYRMGCRPDKATLDTLKEFYENNR